MLVRAKQEHNTHVSEKGRKKANCSNPATILLSIEQNVVKLILKVFSKRIFAIHWKTLTPTVFPWISRDAATITVQKWGTQTRSSVSYLWKLFSFVIMLVSRCSRVLRSADRMAAVSTTPTVIRALVLLVVFSIILFSCKRSPTTSIAIRTPRFTSDWERFRCDFHYFELISMWPPRFSADLDPIWRQTAILTP